MNELSKDYYANCKFSKPAVKKKKREVVRDATYYKVWNACNGTCQLCGSKQSLEMHHVLGRGKDLTNNYRYCIMLCWDCHHIKVHGNQKKYRPILLKKCEKIYRRTYGL